MKITMLLLLLIVSMNAFAEWTFYGGNEEHTAFVDIQSLRKKGNIVKMSTLIVFKTAQTNKKNEKYLSHISRDEYSCKKETIRSFEYSEYSTSGEVISKENIKENPKSIRPKTIEEGLFKIACDISDERTKRGISDDFTKWTKVGENYDMGMITYIDEQSARKNRNKIRLYVLEDYKKKHILEKRGYLSSVSHQEYDCENETLGVLLFFLYAGNMSKGELILSEYNIKQTPVSIIPKSTSETVFKIVCANVMNSSQK